MRFCSLGSGSSGNATVVETRNPQGATRVLIDCGFTLRELDRRLARAGLMAADIDAVFVTHEHGDHVGCALGFARRQRVPLWTSEGTRRALDDSFDDVMWHAARDGVPVGVGDLLLQPYTVPHDAREPLQLRVSDGRRTLGMLTDAGALTSHMLAALSACDALLLECNHDPAMLARSSYPAALKARIAGPYGHLSNETAAQAMAACHHGGLRHVVAAHLSERNNRPQLARASLAAACGAAADDIVVADPLLGCPWLDLA